MLGRQSLHELAQFKAFQIAERAVSSDIDLIEKRMVDLPQPATAVADLMLAQEIRQYVRGQKSPIDLAAKSMSDPRILGAILNAPAFLSGLSDTEWNLVRERGRAALHPEQVQMRKWLTKALDDLREGVAATKRMLQERCKIDEDRDGTLAEAASAAKSAAA